MLAAVVYLHVHSYQVAYDFELPLRTSVSCVKHGLPCRCVSRVVSADRTTFSVSAKTQSWLRRPSDALGLQ